MYKCREGHYYDEAIKRPLKDECPFCWSNSQRGLGRNPPPLKLTQEERMYNFYPTNIAEYERAKAVQVPASFTSVKPDTPEARAARRQIEISKGKDVPNYP